MAGQLLLIWRLTLTDLRHRPAQAFLLLLAIAAGAATLTLGLALHGTLDNPYTRTRAATNGPDVVATLLPDGSNGSGPAATANPVTSNGTGPAQAASLLPLQQAPGLVAHSGPFPVTWTLFQTGHSTAGAEIEGRDSDPSAVDQPKLLQGTWVQPGGAVVEAGFANALGLHIGDQLTFDGVSVHVVGTAVTAAIPSYPDVCSRAEGCFLANGVSADNPGLIWTTQTDVGRIVAATSGPEAYFLNLKLDDPTAAGAFADRHNANASPTDPSLISWQQIRDGDTQTLAKVQTILTAGSWLLAMLATASVIVLVGGRMAEQTRRVGLLKAVGGTPRFVAIVLLVEHILIGLCAAGAGLLAGRLAAPLIDGPGAGLLGAASAPALSASTVALVLALALGVAIAATFVPAIRAARQSTVTALNDAARTPRRRASVIRYSARLPAPLLLGTRLAARRPRRLLLSVFSIAVTTSALVAVLSLRAASAGWPAGPRVTQATTIISVVLIALAAVNAGVIAWTTALETRHSAALARALGATPRQITAGLCVAQLLPALVGGLLGIPGGIAMYHGPKAGGTATPPSALWLATIVVSTLLAIGVLTAIPTRFAARRPVVEVLQAESA
jgi:ABC-type lipoprotein release transport system permease subunit